MMNEPIRDITPFERQLLSRLRHRPALYLGKASLRNLFSMCSGYAYAMEVAGQRETHNLLPEGLDAFAGRWYGGEPGTRNWYSIIALREPDEAVALERFFEILDAYLLELGYAPIPVWEEKNPL